MEFTLENVRIVRPGHSMSSGSVTVRNGRIARIDPPGAVRGAGAVVDGAGRLLTPGLIDIHTHGIGRHQYENPQDVLDAGPSLAAVGTTCFVPTVVPRPGPRLLANLERIAEAARRLREVRVPGLHLEGPFMALSGAACPTMTGDVTYLNELIDACGGHVAAMSVSPEVDGILPVIERLRERGIVAFVTHTRATVEQTLAAVDAGARHATHFYDVFPIPPETEPGARPAGAVEVFLADSRTTVDFICDGCHVHPVAIKAAVAAKGWQGVVLITDSNIGAGLPPGEYDTPWGYRVRVRPGDGARNVENHVLAGSALTMNVGMANLLRWLDLPPEQVWAMGTANPARVLGLSGRGVIEEGADADLVLWNEDLTPACVWVGGQRVFPR